MLSITNHIGSMTSQQRYFPFGGVRTDVDSITETDYGYTGQRNLDSEIGLMDYKFRFYSDTLGRFIQPDTLIPDPANPQAWNRFSYVNNRPVNFNDPTGHDGTCTLNNLSDCISGGNSQSGSYSNPEGGCTLNSLSNCPVQFSIGIPVDNPIGTQWFGPTYDAYNNHNNGDPYNYDGYSQGWHG